MGRYDINPKTNKPVRDEECRLPIKTYHGRLYWFIMSILPFIGFLFNAKPPIGIENVPKSGGAVIAGNHTRWSNVFISQLALRRKSFYLGKSSLLKWPIIGSIIPSLGSIPVDRSMHNSRALDFAVQQVKDGALITIFPEGTCNRGDKLLPFKFGAVSIAQKAKVPLVPMAIWKGRTMFGQPITVGKDLEVANKELYESISKMRSQIRYKKLPAK